MREQVEVLEHHAHLAPHLVDAAEIAGEFRAVDHDAAALVLLQPVDAADERGLAGAGGPANDDALAPLHVKVHIAKHVKIAEPLVHGSHFDCRAPSRVCHSYLRVPAPRRRSVNIA